MKRIRMIWVVFILFLLFSGCKTKEKEIKLTEDSTLKIETPTPSPVKTPTPTAEPEPVPEESREGMKKSKITGLWIAEEIADRRPVALMINNISYANPQSGIEEASVLYEAVVEGGITRMLAVFEEITSKRIGSIRSARHYFVSFADEYDAIYAHYGHTKYATKKIAALGIDNLSGLEGIGTTVYYRDNAIKAPHNAFTSSEGIFKGIEKKGYRTKVKEDLNNHFTFYEEDTDLKGDKAEEVILGYSGYTSPYFTYDKENKVYQRYQFKKPHIDKTTGNQLEFKNIIVQFVSYWTLEGKDGYQSMDIEASKGEGLYLSNGSCIPISWEKNEKKKEMHYYDSNGKLLTINPGKTFISIYPESRRDKLIMS